MASFEALTFFYGPDISGTRSHLSWVEAVPRFAPSPTRPVSSASCPADTSWPSSACAVATSVVCAAAATLAAFFCFAVVYATSWVSLTSVAAFSLRLFSSSWVTCSLASSFLFCTAVFSNSTKSRVRHLGGHVSNTIKIVSSVAMNGSFVHCYA